MVILPEWQSVTSLCTMTTITRNNSPVDVPPNIIVHGRHDTTQSLDVVCLVMRVANAHYRLGICLTRCQRGNCTSAKSDALGNSSKIVSLLELRWRGIRLERHKKFAYLYYCWVRLVQVLFDFIIVYVAPSFMRDGSYLNDHLRNPSLMQDGMNQSLSITSRRHRLSPQNCWPWIGLLQWES